MRSKTLKKKAISTEMRQPFCLPKLWKAGHHLYFGNYDEQAYERKNGEIRFISRKGQALKGQNPKRVSAL